MLRKILWAVVAASVVTLLGCNTVAGFGKDVSKVGDKIEDKAEKVKK